jgi:carbonic anhydrase
MACRLVQAETPSQVRAARALFLQYAASLGFDLAFQDFQDELKRLPGEYAPPRGRLLLAEDEGEIVGCVGLRPLEEGICEMKRMYVRPGRRGKGVGRLLGEAVIREARTIGYRLMRLDTIETMKEAIALYRSLGFRDIGPYRYNPIPGAAYMELDLQIPPGPPTSGMIPKTR